MALWRDHPREWGDRSEKAIGRPLCRVLIPAGFFPQRSRGSVSNPASQREPSPKQRKSYRRSVLHKAALAAPSFPPPKGGSLRQLALASIQRLQADSASPATPTTRKRSYSESDSPSALSPSNFPTLAQKIRSDLQISEESPERELLRTQPTLMKSPSPSSPRSFPPPSPLAFTPTKDPSWRKCSWRRRCCW